MKKNNKNGFTFIELIVTMSIVGIMAIVVISYAGQDRKQKEVESAARDVVAVLKEAQNNALSGKNASSTCASYTFTYNSGKTYSVDCGNSITNYALANGVNFQGNGSISFSIPFATVNNDTNITLQKSNICYRVSVSETGAISESKCP